MKASQLEISEVFESLQGEGSSVGTPSLFLRLAGCNLACRWCDSRYAWDFSESSGERETERVTIEELADRLAASSLRHLVITGGERLLQQAALITLVDRLGPGWEFELETNGTVPPRLELAERIEQWNVSPKLASSGMVSSRALHPAVLAALRETGRAWLKLVVADEPDFCEAERLVVELDWPRNRVLLLPQAVDSTQLRSVAPRVASACIRLGFRYSPRLHIDLWGGARGR